MVYRNLIDVSLNLDMLTASFQPSPLYPSFLKANLAWPLNQSTNQPTNQAKYTENKKEICDYVEE